jgi:hypothetical protein
MIKISDVDLPDIMLLRDAGVREILNANILELLSSGKLFFQANTGEVFQVELLTFWHEGCLLSAHATGFGSVIFDEDGEEVVSVPPQTIADIRQRSDDILKD